MESKLTAIIIEDDEEAMRLLEIYLQDFKEIELIDKSLDPEKGLLLLEKKLPDIVFLDIDMPGLNGLSLADEMKKDNLTTEVVFTTAHRHYAYQALHIEPLDYLIKPFGQIELSNVIKRFHQKRIDLQKARAMDRLILENHTLPKVKLPVKSGIIFVDPTEVVVLRAFLNQTKVFLNTGKEERVSISINKTVKQLNCPDLIRASRSAHININYLKRIEKRTKQCILYHNGIYWQEPINKASLVFFEKQNCFPII